MRSKSLHEYSTIQEMQQAASKKLDSSLVNYLEGGAGSGATVSGNVSAFSQDKLIPHPLGSGVAIEDISISVRLPGIANKVNGIFAAPTAWQRLFHEQSGEVATLQATQSQKALMIVSSFSQTSWEELIAGNDNEKLSNAFYQMLMIEDEDLMLEYMECAEHAGCGAIVITIDAPNGCTACRLAKGKDRVAIADMPLLPKKRHSVPDSLNRYLEEYVSDGVYDWKYIERLIEKSPLPVYLKGILSPKDAKKAIQCGAKGIYVSNHGGRQLDHVISPYDALKMIQDKIQGNVPVLVDGGVRTGIDILKLIMNGATAVGIGRPIHYGLTLGGAGGVERVFEIMSDELKEAMIITGFKNLKKARKKGHSQLKKV